MASDEQRIRAQYGNTRDFGYDSRGGGYRSSSCKPPTGSLENCRWLEMPHTTTDIHGQKNVFNGHENASEMRKVGAKLASCLLQTEGQTDQVSCEHDALRPWGKSREEQ